MCQDEKCTGGCCLTGRFGCGGEAERSGSGQFYRSKFSSSFFFLFTWVLKNLFKGLLYYMYESKTFCSHLSENIDAFFAQYCLWKHDQYITGGGMIVSSFGMSGESSIIPNSSARTPGISSSLSSLVVVVVVSPPFPSVGNMVVMSLWPM